MAYRFEDLDAATAEALRALGMVLQQLRRTRGDTQRSLARRSGLSQSTISRLETGKAPWVRVVWIGRLLAGLDLEPDGLDFRERPVDRVEPGWEIVLRRFAMVPRQAELHRLMIQRRKDRLRQPAAARRSTDGG